MLWDVLSDWLHHKCLRDCLFSPDRAKPFPKFSMLLLEQFCWIQQQHIPRDEPWVTGGYGQATHCIPTLWQQWEKHTRTHSPYHRGSVRVGTNWWLLPDDVVDWRCRVLGPGLNCLIVPSTKRQKEDPPFKQSKWAQCSVLAPPCLEERLKCETLGRLSSTFTEVQWMLKHTERPLSWCSNSVSITLFKAQMQIKVVICVSERAAVG